MKDLTEECRWTHRLHPYSKRWQAIFVPLTVLIEQLCVVQRQVISIADAEIEVGIYRSSDRAKVSWISYSRSNNNPKVAIPRVIMTYVELDTGFRQWTELE